MLFLKLKNIHSLHVCDILFLNKGCKNITVQCNSRFFMIYFNMQSTSLKTTDSWGSRITNQAQAATKSLLDAREIRLQTP